MSLHQKRHANIATADYIFPLGGRHILCDFYLLKKIIIKQITVNRLRH